jgi:hypothetical protein
MMKRFIMLRKIKSIKDLRSLMKLMNEPDKA